eukprot:Plantae.Rhodophyta-Rhodochaete_pulchella.ctg35405.p1 GENE.Plantae.Rhodophyta-Rhodochaete_pulchella.ctg35405~~Plantae.Rhodophyta-Rhodochaete_pulchella.ctg35405.p1  ORF type:complete len:158 (+),score=15.92 Plantae.Rhodophyta-Rhodochaete_pulchella.ctg35405:206-679(+)
MSSQLGYCCFLSDRNVLCVPIFIKSYISRRVTRSVLAEESIAFGGIFDTAFTVSQELHRLPSKIQLPVHLFTDSKSLFAVIPKGYRASEKKLVLDIGAREGFRRFDISNIGFAEERRQRCRWSEDTCDPANKKVRDQMRRRIVRGKSSNGAVSYTHL